MVLYTKQTNFINDYLFLIFLFFLTFQPQLVCGKTSHEGLIKKRDYYVQSLASLIFSIQTIKEALDPEVCSYAEKISFSHEEIAFLWEKVHCDLNSHSSLFFEIKHKHYLDKAYILYNEVVCLAASGLKEEAQELIRTTEDVLQVLWDEAILSEEDAPIKPMEHALLLRQRVDLNLNHNSYISSKIRKKIKPYVLPLDHSMRKVLDDICLNTRVTTNAKTFHEAGFKTISKRPRSFIRIASHPKMPGYLVKVYLDNVLKEKMDKESWEWLLDRCEGAKKIRNVIQKESIKHFVVPKKWIYCFPQNPSPPNDSEHTRHLALLLVTDMNLTSMKQNLEAWHSLITPNHLDELYLIITRARGSSYRPDNIAYTQDDQFAFIDTEYPSQGPDFNSIRPYLNHDMRDYWDDLIKHGGF